MPDREPSVEKHKKEPHFRGGRSAREAALELLHSLFQHPDEGTPLPVMLACTVQEAGLDKRDAALLSELAYGVLRRYVLLDVLLDRFLSKPEALSSRIRMLLRLGVYELLFMGGIPARATVSEYAGLARRRFGQRAGGLVNGVLRSADRDDEELLALVRRASAVETASIPVWLMNMWVKQYGAEKAYCFASNTLEQAAPCWRVNMARDSATALRDSWLERGYVPVGRHGFTSAGLPRDRAGAAEEQQELTELEARGFLTRQGVSSQLVAEFIADWVAQHGQMAQSELWDACCGRGGKTAALLEKGVRVALASDPAQFRVDELRRSVSRLGLQEPKIACAQEQDVEAFFPLILLDVPCSGTGTLGRVPELRIRLTPEKLNEAERLQASILEDAWSKLQTGGFLFYVTCALNQKENERRIAKFLAVHGTEHGGNATLCEQRLFLPDLLGHDALFLAVLRKEITE